MVYVPPPGISLTSFLFGGVLLRTLQVSRAYRSLYDLESLKPIPANLPAHAEKAQHRNAIFESMIELDRDINVYTNFDPLWRAGLANPWDSPAPADSADSADSETSLLTSLRVAGILMTAG